MALSPRTPLLVGGGQLSRRPDDPTTASEPVDMMADVLRAAEADSGGRDLLARADSVRVMALLSWHYLDPGALLGERLGAAPRQTVLTTTGGNSPQMVVNDTAAAIARGELDVALIAGAEAVYTRRRARGEHARLPWPTQEKGEPTLVLGDDRPGTTDAEMARGLLLPTQIYPIFENALRAAAGESIDDHQRKIADLWSRFSHVAANNPHAWSRQPLSPEQIATVTDDNRIIGFPYTKSMNANIDTDQAAGLIMCSVAAAEAAGVPRDRWVFALSGAEAHDHYYVSERADLHSSPAIRAAGAAALAGAGVGIDDIAHVDVYSCFPSAVQMGANALALSLDRQLTVTGGLSFAGGPGNNYSTHAIAAMLDALRADPGSLGLVTALGWYATKHAVGVYSTEPPLSSAEFARSNPQREVDALPMCTPEPDYAGDVTVETYTVMHERDGSPAIGLVACRTPSGGRTWGNVRDADGLRALLDADPIGTAGTLAVDGTFALA